MRKARELGRGGDQLRLALVQALLLDGAHQQVLDELPEVLPFDSEVRSDINVARAEALFSLERLDDSAAILKDAIAALPTPRAYAAAARLALFQGDIEAAKAGIDEGLEKYPDVVTLHVVRGELFLVGRQLELAMGAFETAIGLALSHFSSRIGLARTHIGLRQFEEARAVLETLAKEAPEDPTVLLLRGVVALESADYVAAAGLADEVLGSYPDNLTAIYIAGAASYALDQIEKAHSLLSRYVAEVSTDVVARKMLAAVQLRLGQASDAQETLEPASADSEGDREFLSLASTAAVIAGDLERGQRYLELATTNAPDDPALRARLGLVKIAAGDTYAGTSDLERALELDPGQGRAELALILTYLKERRFEEALTSAHRLVAKSGDSPAGYVLAGIAQMGLDDVDGAKASFEQALRVSPGAPDASANLAHLEVLAGNPRRARELLATALEHNPQHSGTMLRLGKLEADLGNAAAAKGLLQGLLEVQPQHLEAAITLIRAHLQDNDPEQAIEVGQAALAAHRRQPDLLLLVGQAEMAAGQPGAAAATFQTLVQEARESADALYWLAAAQSAAGKADLAEDRLRAALELDPGHLGSHHLLARLLTATGRVEEARPYVETLARTHADRPEVQELQGLLALKEGDAARAAGLFESARRQADHGRLALAHAEALWRAEDREAGVTTLRGWISDHPADATARLRLVSFLVHLGEVDAAVGHLEELLVLRPDNWVAMNELAWLQYTRGGELSAAAEHARQAHQLAPDSPQVMDTFGVILMAEGDVKEALRLLRDAANAMPEHPVIVYHHAQALSRMGEREYWRDQAREVLRRLLSEHETFDDREGAEQLLEELGG